MIYLALTTTDASDWRAKINEIDELNLSEISLFPTVLSSDKRQELYILLEKTQLKKAPFVHLRHDMYGEEIDYLINRWGTKVFCTHSRPDSIEVLRQDTRLARMTAVENACHIDKYFLEALKISPRICLDISHYHDKYFLQKKNEYNIVKDALNNYPVLCNHVSAIQVDPFSEYQIEEGINELIYESHTFSNLNEFDYIVHYKKYLSKYIAVEVENTFLEQLKAKKYIKKVLNCSR